jgi:ATP-dependent helicase HepA
LEGFIVLVDGDDRVFAKLVNIQDEIATIEFFHSVAERVTETIDVGSISRLELPKETRVFVEISFGYWRVGRIISHLNEDEAATHYEVRFPNGENRDVKETELFVRCLDVYADPAGTLAAGCAESQMLADRRRNALKAIRKLRSACEGLTGPYSAAIELMPHQMASIRKVLQDTQVRYLLADEVGLGKTIEAGAIIRQMLLDRRALKVLILVPEKLVSQWREELKTRFYIEPDSPSVQVHQYAEAIHVETPPDLLVVDEAHRVIATDRSGNESIASSVEQLARSVESILLLSATPVLGDEARLFGLLHLLDPSAYPKSDFEGFRRKVESRQEIGRLLMTMQPGGTAFVVKEQAKTAREMFLKDPFVQLVANDVVNSGDDAERRDQAVILLRDHIARTYRIHDRLLRSRRVDAEAWAMRPRGEPYPKLSHVRLCFDTSTWARDLSEALEAWRIAAASHLEADESSLIERWRTLVMASFYSRSAMTRILDLLEPVFEGEGNFLAAIKEVAVSDFDRETRLAAVCEELRSWRSMQSPRLNKTIPKVICFTSDLDDAKDLFTGLKGHFGPFDAMNISDASDELERAGKITEFRKDPQSWILVGSRDAEEGLNLQFVDAIFHVDLPTDVARLEQRIGRLDRFGRTLHTLEHRLFLPDGDEDAPWYAWMDVLINGFQIFNNPVSDIQFKLAELETLIWERFLKEGAQCAEDLSEVVATMIEEERVKLNEQHTLDEIANIDDQAESLIERMEEAEEDEKRLNSIVSEWTHDVLHLEQLPRCPKAKETHRVFWNRPLLPRIPWQKVLESSLDRPLTWRRSLAQSSKSVPSLLRPGSDLLNALERVANWDDRGSSYMTWRVDPSIEEIWVGFRWVWVLSPGLSSETAVWKEVGRPDLYRRTEAYLPILSVDQWTNFDGEVVEDGSLLRQLSRPYTTEKNVAGMFDINLGSRPEALAEVVDPVVLRDTLPDIRERAMRNIWDCEAIEEALTKSKVRLERDDTLIRRSLNRREDYLREEFGQAYEGVGDALEDLDAIRQAIETPKLRLDECGLMILSPGAPNAGGE